MWKIWESIVAKAHEEGSLIGKVPNRALIDATDTFFRKPGIATKNAPHIRDATDLKRFIFTVVVALLPCYVFGTYNVGRNAYLSIGVTDATFIQCCLEGAMHVLPMLILTYLFGGGLEGLFAQIRGHEISEGFLVTGALIPLIVPPTLPLWQLLLGVAFGVVIGKEVFGGVGMNIFNPAMVARAFLFFSYPAQMSGDVWVAKPFSKAADGSLAANSWTSISPELIQKHLDGSVSAIDGYSGATALAEAAVNAPGVDSIANTHTLYSVNDMIFGFIPGSVGETSLIAIAIGALILVLTGVGSWRTMVGVFAGGAFVGGLLNWAAQSGEVPTFFALPFWEHFIMGSFAFGAVFMATDPVSSPFHKKSRWIYGFLIGAVCVIIRTINPAYPEGMMLAVLFMNIFSPLIDHYVVESELKKRAVRYAAK